MRGNKEMNGFHHRAVALSRAGIRRLLWLGTAIALIATPVALQINVQAAVGSATHFMVVAPATVTAGVPFDISVTAQDSANNTDTGYSGTVHFTSPEATPPPVDSTLTNGVGTFSATLKTQGDWRITATDSVTASITGTTGTITVSSGGADHFVVYAPCTATAGTAFDFTVWAEDAGNNVSTGYSGTVRFTSTETSTSASTTLTNGTGTFSTTLRNTGNQTITATDSATPSVMGASGPIMVVSSTTHYSVSVPATATAGTAFTFTVTAQDSANNTNTGDTALVKFSSTDAAAVLPASSTLTNGVGTFSATLKTAGDQTITATDPPFGSDIFLLSPNGSTSVTPTLGPDGQPVSQGGPCGSGGSVPAGTSGPIVVSSAGANHFAVSAPATATAGAPLDVTVTAQDLFNNAATGYAGTVTFISTDGAATMPASTTLTNGVGIFSATLNTAGNRTITATDTATASVTGTSGNIAVSADNPTHFSVVAPPTATAGTVFNFSVTAQDQFNNTATGYTGTVNFSSSDGTAVLPANSTLTNGSGTFGATLKTAGNQTITATDAGTASISGTSGTIVVSSATTDHFMITAPAAATAGTPFNFTVTAQDVFNNTAAGYVGTVKFVSSDGTAVLPASSTLTNAVGTFSATLKTAGNQTITGTDTVTASITGTSGTIVVSAAALDHLVLAPASATILAGTTQASTATGYDAYGNSKGDVTAQTIFTISPNGPTTGASCTGPACGASRAATYPVTGTDAGKTGIATLTVIAAALDHLVLSPANSSLASGVSQAYTAIGYDVYGNSRGDVTSQTKFTISPNGLTTGASCTANACRATRAGTYLVTGTDTGKTGGAVLTVKSRILFARSTNQDNSQGQDDSQSQDDTQGQGNSQISIMNADGSGLGALTAGGFFDRTPAWSPDMTRVAFASNRSGNLHVYVMNADGTGLTGLTTGSFSDSRPAWSPDGSRIAFSSTRGGRVHIFVMNANGTGITALTTGSSFDNRPAWSPDGSHIAFSSTRAGHVHIYLMNANGSSVAALTSGSFDDSKPAWSPDGRHLAFTSTRSGNAHIYVMNANGSGITAVTSGSSREATPTWSPDGSQIAFSRTGNGGTHIYRMNADGTGVSALTAGTPVDSFPGWS